MSSVHVLGGVAYHQQTTIGTIVATLCGAPKKTGSGTCQMPLTTGSCPHHGIYGTGTSPQLNTTSNSHAVAADDPFPTETAAPTPQPDGVGAGSAPRFSADTDLAAWLNSAGVGNDHYVEGYETTYPWQPHSGPWSSDAYQMAVAFDEPVKDPAHLIAYYMRGEMAMCGDGFDGDTPGDPLDPPDGHGRARVWHFSMDMTKSRRDDVGIAMEGFFDHVEQGSPVRKTNKAGPDTKGTRAVDGVGQKPLLALR